MSEPNAPVVPEPMATGVLSERPLAQLLAYARDHKMNGTFELADDPRQYGLISVSAGAVARVWTSEPVSYLGHVLYEGGAIDAGQLGASLAEIAATKELHGQLLLSRGLISQAQLATALRQQRLRKLHHAFTFPPTARFAYYSEVDLVGERPGDVEPIDPLPAIWRGIVTQPQWDHVSAAVLALAGRHVKLTTLFDMQTFRDVEREAIESLYHWPATIPLLATRPGMDEPAAQLVVYFLLMNKLAEVTDAPSIAAPPPSVRPLASPSIRVPGIPSMRPSGLVPAVPSPPSSARLSAPPPSSRSVAPPSSAHAGVPSSGPVSSEAPPSSVRPTETASMRPMTSVRPSPFEPPPEDPEAQNAVAQAELQFMLGERREALELVRNALTLSPKMPAALVLLAALEASAVKKGDEDKLRDIARRLDLLISRNPQVRRGRYYRSQLRRRLGDVEGAVDDLEIAVEQDPDDADARSALKIMQQKAAEPPKATSFLDRIRSKL
jgi:hypothetical protein